MLDQKRKKAKSQYGTRDRSIERDDANQNKKIFSDQRGNKLLFTIS